MVLTLLIAVASVLAVGLLVWHRTPWGRRRPLPRYAVLSMVAHLVLAIIAATVRVVAWEAGPGEPEPIRVTVLTELPPAVEEMLHEETANALQHFEEPSPEIPEVEPSESEDEVATTVESTEPIVAEMLEAPPLTATQQTIAESTTPPSDALADLAATMASLPNPADAAPTPSESASAMALPEAPVQQQAVQQPTDARQETPREVSDLPPAPPAASPFADRLNPNRLSQVIEQGGSRETEEAVANALAWLATAQSSDGRWNAAQWGGGRETARVLNHDRGRTGAQADAGITGLALLTFLGAGQSHQTGDYQQTMADGLNSLIRNQKPDGNLAGDALPYAQTYCHSMATFALAESLAMTQDQRLVPSVQRAVRYLTESQDVGSGGWRYRPGQPGDLSQLGWVIMALRSAELGGVDVPDSTWKRIEHFLSLVGRGQHGGLGCYMPGSRPSRAMTAEALYCRQILGLTSRGREQLRTQEAVAYLSQELPGDTTVNLYHWYYASLALHHASNQTPIAKPTWKAWNERLQTSLLPRQEKTGAARGSWAPNTVWAGYGGRVYSTAMATMCLEVYYRYHVDDPKRDPWVAAREAPEYR